MMNDIKFALRLHDLLSGVRDAIHWYKKEEKRKRAGLYALVRFVFSNGVEREDLILGLKERFGYSRSHAIRIIDEMLKDLPVTRTTERQKGEWGKPGSGPEKAGRPRYIYKFESAAPVEEPSKPSFAQLLPVCLYDRGPLEEIFKLSSTLNPSYRKVIIDALTDCGFKDIYECKLSDDDLIADPRYGMGCLMLTSFKILDQIREKWRFT